jgi:hypothetical protein
VNVGIQTAEGESLDNYLCTVDSEWDTDVCAAKRKAYEKSKIDSYDCRKQCSTNRKNICLNGDIEYHRKTVKQAESKAREANLVCERVVSRCKNEYDGGVLAPGQTSDALIKASQGDEGNIIE